MSALLRWQSAPPPLRRPVMLVALDGFVDAGAAASTAAMFLRHRWRAELVGSFDRDAFVDYRARRPTVVVDNGEIRRVEWPEIELLTAEVEGPHDAVFLLGPEPDMSWEKFGEAVGEACQRLDVEAVISLGAYPAAVPHTREPRIVKATNGLPGDIVPEAVPVTGYTGPIGAASVLQWQLRAHGIPSVGLWAEVPHYIAGAPNPGSALALVRLAAACFSAAIDTTELEAAAKMHQEQVETAVAEHPEAAEMIATLERYLDEDGSVEDLPTGEDLANEIERFLRSQSD